MCLEYGKGLRNMAIMRVRCLKHTEETEEAYAYYTGYLTEKILEKICR